MTDDFDPDAAASYDYDLPPELIAATPPADRTDARLLVVERSTGRLSHQAIRDLPGLLNPGDCLVLNNTRVLPARLRGVREATGGKWEGLFLREASAVSEAQGWELLGQTRGRLREGETVLLSPTRGDGPRLRLVMASRGVEGVWRATPDSHEPASALLDRYGDVPLPPYIRKGIAELGDRERYQTVFAREPGSVAAPTAGLHFTNALLEECRDRGIRTATVTLHVGVGTFRPMAAERLGDHVMHAETAELSPAATETLRDVRMHGGRIVAVGTTSVRTLETAAAAGEPTAYRGDTDLFIRPPYRFRAVDALLTNFHLPRSTLLVLVSTFAGRELIRRAYAEAVERRYRFFSYGDAMLIL